MIKDIYEHAKKTVGLDDPKPVSYVIPTGSIGLNRALGIGGYPSGRVVEILGMEHGGKSTLAMHACIEAQKMGLPFAYLDCENALDYNYFRQMGVKGEPNEDWLHLTPETGEDTWRTIEVLIDDGIKMIIVDSVSAMTPLAEINGDYGESQMGLQARMMGQGFRKTISKIAQNDVCVIFINQIRMKIGVMFGSPETTSGGKALQFFASIRIDIRQTGDEIEEKGDKIGKYSRVKIIKNKLAKPYTTCQIPIVYGLGINQASEIFDEALAKGIITKTGTFYQYQDKKYNGKANMVGFIKEHLQEFLDGFSEK